MLFRTRKRPSNQFTVHDVSFRRHRLRRQWCLPMFILPLAVLQIIILFFPVPRFTTFPFLVLRHDIPIPATATTSRLRLRISVHHPLSCRAAIVIPVISDHAFILLDITTLDGSRFNLIPYSDWTDLCLHLQTCIDFFRSKSQFPLCEVDFIFGMESPIAPTINSLVDIRGYKRYVSTYQPKIIAESVGKIRK